jgi:hypothetical protein
MTSAEQGVAGIGPTPLKAHRYPAWLLGFSALVVAAVVYSATLIPPYLEAVAALTHGHRAVGAKDRTAADAYYLDVLRLVPSSKAALELAILLLAEPSEARQRRGLDYLAGIKLDKHDWQKVSAVLPDKFRGAFTTTSTR